MATAPADHGYHVLCNDGKIIIYQRILHTFHNQLTFVVLFFILRL